MKKEIASKVFQKEIIMKICIVIMKVLKEKIKDHYLI